MGFQSPNFQCNFRWTKKAKNKQKDCFYSLKKKKKWKTDKFMEKNV